MDDRLYKIPVEAEVAIASTPYMTIVFNILLLLYMVQNLKDVTVMLDRRSKRVKQKYGLFNGLGWNHHQKLMIIEEQILEDST